jgi:hypothetical protein
MDDADHAELFKRLYHDRSLAHRVLFKDRHPNTTPFFHEAMREDWHAAHIPRLIELAFRGSAKSTIAEEAIILRAGFREFRNGLIIGETYDRASERLSAIRNEIETNDDLVELFGDLKGPVWGEGELVLSNGVRILAMGRGAALRGIKHNDARPDAVFCDDLESKESVRAKEARHKVRVWFFTELLPACAPHAFIRMAATPLDLEALAVRLSQDPSWVTRTYPITYIDDAGELQPSWPDRFPLDKVLDMKSAFQRVGLLREFDMEYMCLASSPTDQVFKSDMFRTEPTVRTWQAVYAMFDPARTTNKNSATTGYACWSWIGNRLVVWDAWGKMLMPDEIVSAVFDCALAPGLEPTWIGVEEDGLNEFLMQPIRQEQVRRGVTIPVRAMRAPKGKLDFIRGLQPFFNAREVYFVGEMPELRSQLLSFPTGRIDAPNALAYALKMRPGAPIYDDFGSRHVAEGLEPAPGTPSYLCLNATAGLVTGVLAQFVGGAVRIYADYVREGEPLAVLSDMVAAANLDAGRQVKLLCGPHHNDRYTNVGLKQAAARLPMPVQGGATTDMGRAEIVRLLQREVKGFPALMVSSTARWTLNAFAGGYARSLTKQGVLADYAEEGQYRVLMEGLEAFAGLLHVGGSLDEQDDGRVYGTTASGASYVTMRR